MRLGVKINLVIIGFSIGILLTLVGIFWMISYEETKESRLHQAQNNLQLLSNSIEHELFHYTTIVESISSSDLIVDTLNSSNTIYNAMDQTTRDTQISTLNDQWQDALDTDPIIVDTLSNQVSTYLNNIVESDVDYYGEIFVTNKYGLIIGTSGRLSTMAHAHKYWWEGAVNDGDYQIYFDDRGYDESVGSVVIGVVKVIEEDGEFLGVIKVNIKLDEMLEEHINTQNDISEYGEYVVARRSGLIVSQEGTQPLSESLNEDLMQLLNRDSFFGAMQIDNKAHYVGLLTMDLAHFDDHVYFGGRDIDDEDVNIEAIGASWKIIYYESVYLANLNNRVAIRNTSIFGTIAIIIVFIAMSSITKRLTDKVLLLREHTAQLREGKYDTYSQVTGNDEITELTNDLNTLSITLKNNTTSIKNYEKELNARQKLEKKLIEISRFDELTEIYNRRAFNEFFSKYLSNAIRKGYAVGFILFDIDDFKLINDKHGHLQGDKVLVKLAEVVQKITRDGDVFCRWGGEEFVVLADNVNEQGLQAIAEKILKSIRDLKFTVHSGVTVSIGCTLSKENDTVDSIILRADKGLYIAKSSGKNQIKIQK